MDRLSDDQLFTSPMTFMGAPHGRPGPANKAAILGIPFDCGTNMRIGARGGPDSVRQQSALMRRFNPTNADFDPVAALGLVDCGNVRLTPSKIVDAFERTEQAVDRIVQAGAIPIPIGGGGGFAQRIAEFRDKVGKRPVYLCFDMDVFDPSTAPGVCTPSWGGLSAREGIDLLRCLTDLNIVAVDVNTVSPPQDVNGMAAHLCAHVIYETLVLLCRQLGLAGDC